MMTIPVCSSCDAPSHVDRLCACGGAPEFVLPPLHLPASYKEIVRFRRVSRDPMFASGVWRYAEFLPVIPRDAVVTMNEGNMPLYESPSGAAYARVRRVGYLHLGMNPTGSFKDLGMTVAVSAARAAGAQAVACASTGNTASSMAAYAARAGLEAYAVIPKGRISAAKLAQMRDYGARVVEVDGSFDDAFSQISNVVRGNVFLVNSVNPYRIEGQKCAAFAMLDALDWIAPDWVVVPGGNLGNVSAIAKGLREAADLGLIGRLPRIAVAQAAGAAPLVTAWEHRREIVPVVPQTSASAIAIGAPKSGRRALRELHRFDGAAVAVPDDDIDAAKAQIGSEGIGCEPASAAALAGARELRSRGVIAAGAHVCVVLTGHVLKDSEASLRAANLRDQLRAQEDRAHAV
jgi:threonine synthase